MRRSALLASLAPLASWALLPFFVFFVGNAAGEDAGLSPQAQRALGIASQSWQSEETEHFTVHYSRAFIGKPVVAEAEFYYRIYVAELELEPHSPSGATPASHLFLFESREAWSAFQAEVSLEAWTGGAVIGLDLFVPRYPEFRFKGNALGHEVAHLVVRRHLGDSGGGLPLWLSEGYAEEASTRAYATFMRSRGYRAKPRVPAVEQPFELGELLAFTGYPAADRVSDFYRQSHQLVSFIRHEGGRERFARFFKQMAAGESLESQLATLYHDRWPTLEALDVAFREKLVSGSEPSAERRSERDE